MVLFAYTEKASPWIYLKIKVNDSEDISLLDLRYFIQEATKQFMGVIDGSVQVDVLKTNGPFAIVRIPKEASIPVWASLFFANGNEKQRMRIICLDSKPNLFQLSPI